MIFILIAVLVIILHLMYFNISRGGKGIMADIFITLQETKYIILILDIMIQ